MPVSSFQPHFRASSPKSDRSGTGPGLAFTRAMTAAAHPPPTCMVLGTDFSEGAAAALREARRLQSWTRCPLHVVHVVSGNTEDWHPGADEFRWLAAQGINLDELVLRQGLPAVELVRFADTVRAMTLILGSHGQSGFQPLRMGSTAERATSIAGCPVLIVNPRGALAPLRRPPTPGHAEIRVV